MVGQRKALIVASDVYEHDGLKQLVSPAADAEALATVLSNPQIGDYSVQVLRNNMSYEIMDQIEELFYESHVDDVLLLHFSCHGLKSESGELFFAACNTRLNRLNSTAVSADFVRRRMLESRSRSIVLLLDCCYSGAFGQGARVRASGDVNVLDSFPGEDFGGGRGWAVITAASPMEYAFEGDQLTENHSPQPSIFTAGVVEGLKTGDADLNKDGWVSPNELYGYVFAWVRERNRNQTPRRKIETQGELYLAHSRHTAASAETHVDKDAEIARLKRELEDKNSGFSPDDTLDVRQVDDYSWITVRPFRYRAGVEDFEVPVGYRSNIGSEPRIFAWFIPRYGRYVQAAVLHDYLCRVYVPAGRLSRIDADGIFRQAMRQLGLPFWRRWIIWAAFRLAALTEPTGLEGWWREAWRVALISMVAMPVLVPATIVTAITIVVIYLLELLTWVLLEATHRVREHQHRPAKYVNKPTLNEKGDTTMSSFRWRQEN